MMELVIGVLGLMLVCCGIEVSEIVAVYTNNAVGGILGALIIVVPMYVYFEYKSNKEFKARQEADRRHKEQSARLREEQLATIDNIAPEDSIFVYSEEMIQELLKKKELTRMQYCMIDEYAKTKGYVNALHYRWETAYERMN